MSKELAVLATVAAGGLVAAQAPVNNILSQRVGSFGAVSEPFRRARTSVSEGNLR